MRNANLDPTAGSVVTKTGLQKDPRDGPPIPVVELTAEGTKKFLEQTKLYFGQFPLPFLSAPGSYHTDAL